MNWSTLARKDSDQSSKGRNHSCSNNNNNGNGNSNDREKYDLEEITCIQILSRTNPQDSSDDMDVERGETESSQQQQQQLEFPRQTFYTANQTPISTEPESSSPTPTATTSATGSPITSSSSSSQTASLSTDHLSALKKITRDIKFRPIEPKDRERAQYLHEQWFPVSYQSDFYDELVHQRMTRTGEKLFTSVAAHDDQMVACVVGSMIRANRLNFASRKLLLSNPDRYTHVFYIMTLGTETQYRQMGLATMLLKQCMEEARRIKTCGTLYLHVLTDNTSAINFYERLGFWRVQLIPDYYTIDGEKRHCFLYAKYFNGNTGHLDAYIVLAAFFAAMWKRIKSPLSFWKNHHFSSTIKSS